MEQSDATFLQFVDRNLNRKALQKCTNRNCFPLGSSRTNCEWQFACMLLHSTSVRYVSWYCFAIKLLPSNRFAVVAFDFLPTCSLFSLEWNKLFLSFLVFIFVVVRTPPFRRASIPFSQILHKYLSIETIHVLVDIPTRNTMYLVKLQKRRVNWKYLFRRMNDLIYRCVIATVRKSTGTKRAFAKKFFNSTKGCARVMRNAICVALCARCMVNSRKLHDWTPETSYKTANHWCIFQ